jgi:hypothetical protein
MLNYIIYAPQYNPNSGGYSALHYLSEALHNQGIDRVYITTHITNPRWYARPLEDVLSVDTNSGHNYYFLKCILWLRTWIRIPTIVRKISRKIKKSYPEFIWNFLDKETTVVVYAENESGNPLQAKHIARWIMMNPKDDSASLNYLPNEHIFLYHEFFKVPHQYEAQIKGVLTSIDMTYHLNTFTNQHLPNRSGGAYLVKKGMGKPLTAHGEDFVCIDTLLPTLTDQEKANFFNQIKTFISYDAVTFVAIQAALCGCEVVMIPDDTGDFSKEKLMSTNRYDGIAYGLEDLPWARETLHLLPNALQELNQKNLDTIKNFRSYWENFFRLKV